MSTNILEGCLRLLPLVHVLAANAILWHATRKEDGQDKFFCRFFPNLFIIPVAMGAYSFWHWVLEGFGVLA